MCYNISLNQGDVMKIQELRENKPLEIIEVSKHMAVPTFETKKILKPEIVEFKQIQMRVFTDGEIIQVKKQLKILKNTILAKRNTNIR